MVVYLEEGFDGLVEGWLLGWRDGCPLGWDEGPIYQQCISTYTKIDYIKKII